MYKIIRKLIKSYEKIFTLYKKNKICLVNTLFEQVFST